MFAAVLDLFVYIFYVYVMFIEALQSLLKNCFVCRCK